MPIRIEDITIENFKNLFHTIIGDKEKAGIMGLQRNPDDLFERAKSYGVHYANGSWGWNSNIWSRSAANTVVVNTESELKTEHKQLMLNVLEFILCRPLIQADANLGSPGSVAEMKCRLYCDPQFPDIAYRWKMLNFSGNPDETPDVELFFIPHYLDNPDIPHKNEMLRVLRFPNHNYTIVIGSSYQGEVKKAFLSHWIHHVYKKGGTGEHASLKEFSVKDVNNKKKRIVMGAWGLTGSGKSTHGLFVVTKEIGKRFKEKFGIDISEYVYDQALKNDDITAWFADKVLSPERGAWTKTEGVDEYQAAIYKAAISPSALHENTEWDEKGNVNFDVKLFQYKGQPNRNARTVLMLEDTGYFDGIVDSTQPPNMVLFISPGYLADYAWLKITDTQFAAKVLADGRTVGHPAQSMKGVGEEKYTSRYCLPFTMGVGSADHVHRFHSFLVKRQEAGNPIDVYQINTTGRIGTEYKWVEVERDGQTVNIPKAEFEEIKGKRKPVGGTGPTIEETELFIFQAARGAVEYEPHPLWGEKVLVPVKVEGISPERLKELNPFTYRSVEEMQMLLREQIEMSKLNLNIQCHGLDKNIYEAMDF